MKHAYAKYVAKCHRRHGSPHGRHGVTELRWSQSHCFDADSRQATHAGALDWNCGTALPKSAVGFSDAALQPCALLKKRARARGAL